MKDFLQTRLPDSVSKARYEAIGYDLYQQLFSPIKDWHQVSELICIGSALFYDLPFEVLLTDTSNNASNPLMIVGCYRSNEVDFVTDMEDKDKHPLRCLIERMKERQQQTSSNREEEKEGW